MPLTMQYRSSAAQRVCAAVTYVTTMIMFKRKTGMETQSSRKRYANENYKPLLVQSSHILPCSLSALELRIRW